MKPLLTLLLALIVGVGNTSAQETTTAKSKKEYKKIEKQAGIQKALEILQTHKFQIHDHLPSDGPSMTNALRAECDSPNLHYQIKSENLDKKKGVYTLAYHCDQKTGVERNMVIVLYLKSGVVKIEGAPLSGKPYFCDYSRIIPMK